jgi:hypothetical protein
MIKNLFEVSQEEKNRILRLHETATKKQYLIFEQTENPDPSEFGPVNLGQHFGYADYESEAVKADIQKLKPQIEKFISENTSYSKFEVKIEGGESRVTNPEKFKQQGSLALARANSVKKYFEEIFPEQIKNGVLVINAPTDVNQIEIGTTPYGGPGSGDHTDKAKIPLYEKEQFVRFQIKGIGEKTSIPLTGTTGNTLSCQESLTSSGLQGFGDVTKDFTVSIDTELTIEKGEFTIDGYTYDMPDILYFSLDGNTNFKNNSGKFRGVDAPWTRIFLGTALRTKYGTNLPETLSSQGYSITIPDITFLRRNLISAFNSWNITSFHNLFLNSPYKNDSWWTSMSNYHNSKRKNNDLNLLLKELGDEFPWGYLNGDILSPRFSVGPIKVDTPGKPQKLTVINFAPNGNTNWEFQIICK